MIVLRVNYMNYQYRIYNSHLALRVLMVETKDAIIHQIIIALTTARGIYA